MRNFCENGGMDNLLSLLFQAVIIFTFLTASVLMMGYLIGASLEAALIPAVFGLLCAAADVVCLVLKVRYEYFE